MVDISIQIFPSPVAASSPSSPSSTSADAAGVGRQVMTASLDSIIRAGALPPVRADVQERANGAAIEIAHRQVDPVAQQRARELAADVAEPDEADLHLLGLEWCCEAWRLVATRHRSATEIEHRSCPAADPMPALP